MAENKAFTT